MDMSRRQFLGLAGSLTAVVGLGLVGCGGSGAANTAAASSEAVADLSGSITCSGATSFQPLVEDAANAFMDANANVNITISGGGSGQGLSDSQSSLHMP